ncbi:hypothetical protein [Schaalia sp. Marseille-Q2122]|uniref:hypothetical protein n=1 Tax=Schaalia sp. Marseille-Q2122 TaxID=2736604 RepID=UPI0015899E7F|nr:hypothetical protein [Schaalia sp. Marseille-Q2122]
MFPFSRRQGFLSFVVVFAALAVLTAGCSVGGENDEQVQSLRSYSDTSSSAADAGPEGAESLLPLDILDGDRKAEPSENFAAYYKANGDYYLELSHCMEDKGWPAIELQGIYTPQMGIQMAGSEVDPQRYARDFDACQASAPPIPMPPVATPELAEEEYAKAKSAHECLVAHGARMPEFPSKQKFFDDFLVHHAMWNPMVGLDGIKIDMETDPLFSQKSSHEIYEMCPW